MPIEADETANASSNKAGECLRYKADFIGYFVTLCRPHRLKITFYMNEANKKPNKKPDLHANTSTYVEGENF